MNFIIKCFTLFLFLFSIYLFGFSQNENIEYKEDTIYTYVQHMPEFSDGVLGMRRFIAENVEYPKSARDNGIFGKVVLRFEVKKDGEVGKVEILKKVNPLLDNEAVRVIKLLPKFKPGIKDEKPVNVWISIPIKFEVNSLQNATMPVFRNELSLNDYIARNLYNLDINREPDEYGVVELKFEVTKKGKIGKVEVIRGINQKFDKKVSQVIKSLPDFLPGTKNGIPVSTILTIPLLFDEKIYNVNRLPKFKNSSMTFEQYINENIIYPKKALYAGINGSVNIKFELTKFGKIDSIDILNSSNPLFDDEALRLIKSLPELKTELIYNKPANVWYDFPIKFENNKIKIESAEYPGPDSLLYNYLTENIKQKLGNKLDSGSMSIIFEINKNGLIGKKEILKSLNNRVDSIILDAISSLPNFIPGKVNGEIADTWYYLPLIFGDKIFIYVKQMPEFPGGALGLRRYIAENVEYPKLAREKGIQGVVFL